MYHKGEVKVMPSTTNLSDEEEDALYQQGIRPVSYDARKLPGETLPPWVAVLPHSCDSWVIGGYDEICQLIFDLRVILEAVAPRTPLSKLEDEP